MDEISQNQYRQGRKVTLVGMAVSFILAIVKFVVGVLGSSQALVADGIHSLSDMLSDVVVLIGLKMGRDEEDEEHPFGHGRIETLASSIVGLMLAGAGVAMGWAAVSNIGTGNAVTPSSAAIVVAAASILSKEALYWYTVAVAKRIASPAVMSNAWHHRSDALSSVAVLIGVAGAVIHPEWAVLDSWAALIVSVLVVHVGGSFVVSAIKEFIDTAPLKETRQKITHCAYTVEGVLDVHDVRARTSGGKVFVEVHITVDGDMTVRQGHSVAKQVERCLVAQVTALEKAIVHVDPTEPDTDEPSKKPQYGAPLS